MAPWEQEGAGDEEEPSALETIVDKIQAKDDISLNPNENADTSSFRFDGQKDNKQTISEIPSNGAHTNGQNNNSIEPEKKSPGKQPGTEGYGRDRHATSTKIANTLLPNTLYFMHSMFE